MWRWWESTLLAYARNPPCAFGVLGLTGLGMPTGIPVRLRPKQQNPSDRCQPDFLGGDGGSRTHVQ